MQMRMASSIELIIDRLSPVQQKNQATLDYVAGRLGKETSSGQCILHLAPGGEIRKVEWRSMETVDDIMSLAKQP